MSRTASPAPSLRLTRRGRAVLVLLLAGLLLAAFSTGRSATQAADVAGGAGAATPPAQVVVQPGESLWSLAERVAPQNDPRQVIAQIQRLNDLDGSGIQAGQLLLLPVAA
jgi:LysM repeat protein